MSKKVYSLCFVNEKEEEFLHQIARFLEYKKGGWMFLFRVCNSFFEFSIIMKPAFGNLYFIINNSVNQSVFFINSSGPKAGIIKFQWLGFTNTFKRMTYRFFR